MLAVQKVMISTRDGCGRFAIFMSTGMIQPACHMVHASQSVGTTVRKTKIASVERRPKRSDSQPPRMQAGAKISVV